MPRYFVVTLGCKLNQFDSARAEGLLQGQDYLPTDDPRVADVILLNTCTVTSRADRDGRRLARRLRRLNPRARIVATGCYAEREPQTLRALGVFDEVVGLSERFRLPSALTGAEECPDVPPLPVFTDRARGFVRVQEGCDLRCSYCIIPQVRGPGRSIPAEQVLCEVHGLASAGAREVGLTGVNTGSWGADFEPRLELADLLERLLAEGPAVRIRLNSLEPRTVSPRILGLLASHPERLASHIQIPLQSGSDRILGRMSRNYRTAFYRRLIETAVRLVPDICLGADVITGFPGESEEDHAASREFLAGLPLTYLHVFSYSPRPGTRAAAMAGQVDATRVRRRTQELVALGLEMKRAFRRRLLGRTFPAVVLQAADESGWSRSLTGNYIEVLVPRAPAGAVVQATLETLAETGEEVRGRWTA